MLYEVITHPAGPESYKLLETVNAVHGILLSHTGPLAPPSRGKFADPMLLADIGVDFPNIKVIAAHMGAVITSYSIHYTKLYEIFLICSCRWLFTSVMI